MSSGRLAFIGLGAMGEPMAGRLLGAGHEIAVHNRSDGAVERLVALGALRADSARTAVDGARVVITMLPDSPDVEQVAHGTAGVLARLSPGATWIEMSTIAPATARELAARAAAVGAGFLDAPVSGGTVGARDGTLTIMVGGDEPVLDGVRSVLERLGSRITLVGPVGAGQVAKAANQLIVGGTIGLVAEALTLAERLGTDPARVAEALSGGFAASRVLEVHGSRMLSRSFEPGFRCTLQRKDLAIVNAAAHAAGLRLGLADAALQLFERQCDAGGYDLDHAAVIDALRPA